MSDPSQRLRAHTVGDRDPSVAARDRRRQNRSLSHNRPLRNTLQLNALLNDMTHEDAFQPMNIPDVARMRYERFGSGMRLRVPCAHETKVYDAPEKVPVSVCTKCNSIVVPETSHSVVARAVPLPMSMRRDDRWSQLFKIFKQHRSMLDKAEDLVREQEHLLIMLEKWRTAFSRHALVDFTGKHSPMFSVVDQSVRRVVNATNGFQQTIDTIMVDTRHKMLQQVARCIPRTKEEFVLSFKERIAAAHPRPLYHPNALTQCSMCVESQTNVILHDMGAQSHSLSNVRSFIFGAQSTVCSETKSSCVCKNFSVCLDCLLQWYWESSENLNKTFASCPLCRADFHLEDIVPIRGDTKPPLANAPIGPPPLVRFGGAVVVADANAEENAEESDGESADENADDEPESDSALADDHTLLLTPLAVACALRHAQSVHGEIVFDNPIYDGDEHGNGSVERSDGGEELESVSETADFDGDEEERQDETANGEVV